MPRKSQDKANQNFQIELARWLIDRHDNLTESVSNRAGIILSADALLITAMIFMLDNVISSNGQMYWVAARVAFWISIITTAILLIASVIWATMLLANVWRPSKKIANVKQDNRLFFNAAATLENNDDFVDFRNNFSKLNDEQAWTFALGELWATQILYRQRYKTLRIAVRLFLLSILPLFVAVIVWLFY